MRERSLGAGLAAKYPGDRRIASHPSVLLAEGFEGDSLKALEKTWSDILNPDGRALAFDTQTPPRSAGRRSLRITATPARDSGGHLFALLPRGSDTLFARFYVRFEPDADYLHHFVWMGGHNPPTRWPNPRAGSKPAGDDRVAVGIEPFGAGGRYRAPGAWNFYTYWQGMKISADGRYWGAGIAPQRPPIAPKGTWQCVEFMTRLNTAPSADDGALALWIDGKQVMQIEEGTRRGPWTGMGFTLPERGGDPFEGFRFRSTDALKLNYFWLEHYVTADGVRRNGNPNPKPENTVWFDDIVVATEYIGPLA
jgi:hypothetical protein